MRPCGEQYRVALLVAGAGALMLADYLGWPLTYLTMAAIMMAGLMTIVISPEPPQVAHPPKSLAEAVGAPLSEFFSRPHALAFLAVIVLYKLGDAFASSLQTAFLIGGVGFSATEVGAVKAVGIGATLLGAVIASGVTQRQIRTGPAITDFCVSSDLNLGFVAVALAGKSSSVLLTAVVIDNVTGGNPGTAAFVALVMEICSMMRYPAITVCLALFSGGRGRVFAGRPSGWTVELVGWPQFCHDVW